jgi:hypothetical protein
MEGSLLMRSCEIGRKITSEIAPGWDWAVPGTGGICFPLAKIASKNRPRGWNLQVAVAQGLAA